MASVRVASVARVPDAGAPRSRAAAEAVPRTVRTNGTSSAVFLQALNRVRPSRSLRRCLITVRPRCRRELGEHGEEHGRARKGRASDQGGQGRPAPGGLKTAPFRPARHPPNPPSDGSLLQRSLAPDARRHGRPPPTRRSAIGAFGTPTHLFLHRVAPISDGLTPVPRPLFGGKIPQIPTSEPHASPSMAQSHSPTQPSLDPVPVCSGWGSRRRQ